MKILNNLIKLSVFVLFIATLSSCNKNEDPYAAYTPEREASMIKDWKASVKLNKLHLDSTSTGIYFVRDTTKLGTGPTILPGDTVTVKYVGEFLNGTIFDASAYYSKAGTMKYIHKTNPLIPGWEEGIVVLNKGASAAFLIPSAKAYGPNGSGSIPPNEPLIFIIEVVDIK